MSKLVRNAENEEHHEEDVAVEPGDEFDTVDAPEPVSATAVLDNSEERHANEGTDRFEGEDTFDVLDAFAVPDDFETIDGLQLANVSGSSDIFNMGRQYDREF